MITEAEFQGQLIDLAHIYGWKVAHFRTARTLKGWVTPVSADGKGFPDLVMVRGNRLIAAELKSERGKTTEEQRDWMRSLSDAGAEIYLWRPSDWTQIIRALEKTE